LFESSTFANNIRRKSQVKFTDKVGGLGFFFLLCFLECFDIASEMSKSALNVSSANLRLEKMA
jgi:hypothetical protein